MHSKLWQLAIPLASCCLGSCLPSSALKRADLLHVIETENGIELTPYDPVFDEQMALAEGVMREDRDVLRKLAK